ncbi:MAG: hypothetical protein K2P04_00110, partial [Oscillospiraceae bacterium]|nr:hypothetical protein [Oscillospiraceae bacterium]
PRRRAPPDRKNLPDQRIRRTVTRPPPAPDAGGDTAELEPEPVIYPPCPWTVRFYPNQETAELVEILLKTSGKAEG